MKQSWVWSCLTFYDYIYYSCKAQVVPWVLLETGPTQIKKSVSLKVKVWNVTVFYSVFSTQFVVLYMTQHKIKGIRLALTQARKFELIPAVILIVIFKFFRIIWSGLSVKWAQDQSHDLRQFKSTKSKTTCNPFLIMGFTHPVIRCTSNLATSHCQHCKLKIYWKHSAPEETYYISK